jgi:hypothetical protein
MSSGKIVGGIFFTGGELLWMEELSVGSGSDLIDNGWLEIKGISWLWVDSGLWASLNNNSHADFVVIRHILGLISVSFEDGVEGIITNNLSEAQVIYFRVSVWVIKMYPVSDNRGLSLSLSLRGKMEILSLNESLISLLMNHIS